jgi:hypothetical protein
MNANTDSANDCRHHWMLGQPRDGEIAATCRTCGAERVYPAAPDEGDRAIERETRHYFHGVATAAGGARPLSVALSGLSDS